MSISEKLTTIAENEKKVYALAALRKNNEIWAGITNFGARTDYNYAFKRGAWNKNNFSPTYNITPANASEMFLQIDPGSVEMQIDMVELEKNQNINFDFSQCKAFRLCFAGGLFSAISTIDMTNASGDNAYAFYGAYISRKLKKINRLIFGENTNPHSTMFGSTEIYHIGFEGVLAKNGLDISSCKSLDKESITKLINILSSNTSGLTVTLSKIAINNAFGIDIDNETTYPEGSEYYNLRNSKSNWTFNYV